MGEESTKLKHKNILFIHLPKTGGTLINEYCRYTGAMQYYLNGGHAHCPVTSVTNPEKYFKFGLVRNPWDFYVSRYFYYIKKNLPERGLSNRLDAGLHGKGFEQEFPTLKDHIKYGIELGEDRFWFSNLYKEMFCDDEDNVLMDYIGKQENLLSEVEYFLDLNNVKTEVSIRDFDELTKEQFPQARNATTHEHYATYYDDELIDLIAEGDKYIIEKHGYKFGG